MVVNRFEVYRKHVANLESWLKSVTNISALFFSENRITLYKKTNLQFLNRRLKVNPITAFLKLCRKQNKEYFLKQIIRTKAWRFICLIFSVISKIYWNFSAILRLFMGPTTAKMCQKRAIWLVASENDDVIFKRSLRGPNWNRVWLVEHHPSDPGAIIADKLQQ